MTLDRKIINQEKDFLKCSYQESTVSINPNLGKLRPGYLPLKA